LVRTDTFHNKEHGQLLLRNDDTRVGDLLAQIEDLKAKECILKADLEAVRGNREAERAGRIRAEAALRKALSNGNEEGGTTDQYGDGPGRKGMVMKEIGAFFVHTDAYCISA
jgi:hypothetical protein